MNSAINLLFSVFGIHQIYNSSNLSQEAADVLEYYEGKYGNSFEYEKHVIVKFRPLYIEKSIEITRFEQIANFKQVEFDLFGQKKAPLTECEEIQILIVCNSTRLLLLLHYLALDVSCYSENPLFCAPTFDCSFNTRQPSLILYNYHFRQ